MPRPYEHSDAYLLLGVIFLVAGIIGPGFLRECTASASYPAGDTGKIVIIGYLILIRLLGKTVWLGIPLGILLMIRGALLRRR